MSATPSPSRSRLGQLALAGGAMIALLGGGWWAVDEHTGSSSPSSTAAATADGGASGAETCAVGTLPKEARDVIGAIKAGGPFEYPDNDGARFGNYEKHLPTQQRNYYREYTVDNPNLSHRGTRRIVTGGGSETDPDVWYYTADHYESFCTIPDADAP